MNEAKVVLKEITDPVEAARCRAQWERARRNGAWLQAHWPELMPQAIGKFLAVAGGEAFLADTPEAAWNWAKQAHPNDDGALVQYVPPLEGPRFYANRGRVVCVS